MHDGNKLKTKVSNHEIIRIPYQSEEFALKPSLQNLHDGNKLKTKVSNHEIIRIPYQSEDQN